MKKSVPAKKPSDELEPIESLAGEYKLTKAQVRLLEVLRDPKSVLFTPDQLVQQAGVTRGTYYTAFKSKDFVTALEAEMSAYRSANDFAVLHNLVTQAREGKNHQMIVLFEKLQNRLREGGERPAQVILVFEGVERPAKLNELKAKVV